MFSPAPPGRAAEVTDERQNTSLTGDVASSELERAKTSQAAIKNIPTSSDLFFRYGGSVSSTYRYYRNLDNQQDLPDFLRWSWTQRGELWTFVSRNQLSAYAQLSDLYVNRGTGPTYTGIGSDNEGPSLALGYVRAKIRENRPLPVSLTLGRQFMTLGKGIAYSDIHDGVQVETRLNGLYLKTLLSQTKPHEDNLDFSVPGFEKNGDRAFGGAEITYDGLKNTLLYAYGLIQKDRSSADPPSQTQNYHYDSQHVGLGFSHLAGPVEWGGEAIREFGRGYTDASRTELRETEIRAWCALAGIKYRPPVPTHPVFEASFTHASGDPDREFVTNTVGGDVNGTDRNFQYFGYYLGGYALQPRLSNINIVEIGGSFSPLENVRGFQRFALGMKYFLFWKDRKEGAISDFESTEDSADVGSELDFFLHYKITDALTCSVRYGAFYPGEAFSELMREDTEFFSTSLSLSF